MRRSPLLWISSALVFAFLYIPLIVVVVFSFNDSKLNAEWVGFTFDWYRVLFNNSAMLTAARNSLFIAFMAATLATILGMMAGIAMHRFRSRFLPFMTLTPLAMPEILLGVSLLIFFISAFGENALSLLTVIIAHTTFCIGFVAIIVRARLAGMDESVFEAARDLGATPWQTFRLVTFPLIRPAVIAGALMSFTLSIDDFVITFFTAGAGVPTLPLTIYTMIKIAVTPEVNALSTLMMLLTLFLIIVATRVAPDVLRSKRLVEDDAESNA
ncbi:MAG: ABC transporter permease subunit [Burkholderiales bacterium]|jgi:spermidine/putrescine transport system permease protein|nr:ABC transporter permease subunit [Burkholderiales bacterium]